MVRLHLEEICLHAGVPSNETIKKANERRGGYSLENRLFDIGTLCVRLLEPLSFYFRMLSPSLTSVSFRGVPRWLPASQRRASLHRNRANRIHLTEAAWDQIEVSW